MADGLLNKASIILTPTGYKAGTLYNVAPVVEPYEDFDFARASVASRVNSSGLVEMVGRTLSSELVTNGDFATDSDWTKGGGATISDGKANIDGDGSTYVFISQSNIFNNSGATYKVTADVVITSGLGLKFQSVSSEDIGVATTSGSYTFYYTASSSTTLNIARRTGGTAFDSSVTNVSVKEIIDTNNIPRISYDSNGDNGHILLEPTSTNLFPYSEDFSTWNKVSNAVVIDNFTNSPDGTQNASKFTFDGTTNGRVEKALTVTSGNQYTFSVWLKNDNLADTTQVWLAFSTFSQGEYVTVTNEWQRFTTTQTADGTTEYPRIQTSEIGSIFAWGAQFEELSYATSYIPTLTGSTETRATETATGAGSADLINSTEGVLYAEIAVLANTTSFEVLSLSDTTTSNVVGFVYRNTTNQFTGVVKSNNQTSYSQTTTLANAKNYIKVALSYKLNDFKMYINGVLISADTSGNAPIGLNALQFADGNATTNIFYGKCKALAVFNEALSDSELTQLTT